MPCHMLTIDHTQKALTIPADLQPKTNSIPLKEG